MTTLHYKFLKLSNGDNIICSTDDDCSNLNDKKSITICDPVTITQMKIPYGKVMVESYLLSPWVSFIEDTILEIPTKQIIFAANVSSNAKDNYLNFIDKQLNNDLEKESKNNENVSFSREDALAFIKMLGLEEKNEEKDEEQRPITVPGNRTVH